MSVGFRWIRGVGALVGMLMVMHGCSPVEPQPDPDTCPAPDCPQCETISVVRPDSTTVWRKSTFPDTITWQDACCDSVRLSLYRDGELVTFFPSMTPNTGSVVLSELIPATWLEGSGYQLLITDRRGGRGWSRHFSIQPDSLAVIIVTQPTVASVWNHGGSTGNIVFSVPALSGNDSVRVELFKERRRVAIISGWVSATMVVPGTTVLPGWGRGTGYRIRVVSQSGKYGWSAPLTIKASPKDLITVTAPDSSTVWLHGQQQAQVRWTESFGDSVRLELLRNGNSIGALSSWTADSGFFLRNAIIIPSWPSDSTYQVKVQSSSGLVGYSAVFRIVVDTFAVLKVTVPSRNTSWYAGTRGDSVSWTGARGDSADVFLYMDDTLKGVWAQSVPASGPALRDTVMPGAWGHSPNCRIKVVDNQGYYGWSQVFSILKDTTASIQVISPDSTSVWMHGQRNMRVQWQGHTSDQVRVELYRLNVLRGVLVDRIVVDSTIRITTPLDSGLIPGTYRIKVVDGKDNFGWSDPFRIIPDTLGTITISGPEVLYHGQTGATLIVGSVDGDSICAFIYRNNTRLGLFADWSTDTVLVRSTPIPSVWGTGNDFRIRVENNRGRYGLSGPVRMVEDSAQLLVVVQPLPGTVWIHGEAGIPVVWTSPVEIDSAGERVLIEIYKGNSRIGVFSECEIDGSVFSCENIEPIPAQWGTGSDFRLKVTLEKSGLYGWSEWIWIDESLW